MSLLHNQDFSSKTRHAKKFTADIYMISEYSLPSEDKILSIT